MSDVPKIDIMLKDMPERGVIGIGEPPTVSTASAIANAVRNATGATIRSLPLHPHRVLAAIEQQKSRRHACEGLCLRQSRERKRSGRRAAGRTGGIAMPIGGGQDLLARMKDYIDSPDRIVNIKNALDADDHRDAGRRAEDRRGGEDRRPDGERAGVKRLYPAVVGRGRRSRDAADPQPGHRRRQHQPAAALLVLPERGVRLLQEGRQPLLRRRRARTSTTPSSATTVRATSSTRRAWRSRSSPTARSSASSDPNGEREIPAADYFTLPTLQNVLKENVLGGRRAADARDPAGAGQRQARALRSPLQGVARLAAGVRDRRARR